MFWLKKNLTSHNIPFRGLNLNGLSFNLGDSPICQVIISATTWLDTGMTNFVASLTFIISEDFIKCKPLDFKNSDLNFFVRKSRFEKLKKDCCFPKKSK